MKVAILGASPKPDRYSNKAQKMLMDHGHEVIPVSPGGGEVLGVEGLAHVPSGMDTVTLYVSPKHLLPMLEELVEAAPRRVIFNPGTESDEAMDRLKTAGIVVEEACTLVLLSVGEF
ncbi:CoA-binding protein [Haloferula sp.]|uniref:CoA-binding protein n=1 Tax=Haloferula sp. TaxID=2497595 RepID=UPI00329AEA41